MSMNEKQDEITTMILNYLQKHPEAGDTVEGITRWWLEFERVEQNVGKVASALERLIEKGLLRKVKYRDVFVYKLNHKRR